jgi:hypothetical protein
VFPEGITGIGCSLLQIPRELQLFPQRLAAFDRLRLMPFPLPDFVRYAKQFIGSLRTGKQTTIVVGENNITSSD